MTLSQLRKLLSFWQKLLRLQDIDIQLRWAKLKEMTAYGRTHILHDFTVAFIILQPEEYINKNATQNLDIEVTLVHELLHVQERIFANSEPVSKLLDENPTLYNAHEMAIERNAQALVKLRRMMENR